MAAEGKKMSGQFVALQDTPAPAKTEPLFMNPQSEQAQQEDNQKEKYIQCAELQAVYPVLHVARKERWREAWVYSSPWATEYGLAARWSQMGKEQNQRTDEEKVYGKGLCMDFSKMAERRALTGEKPT